MRVPGSLVRQFYVPGSLRNDGDGFRLEATNPVGDGTLVGIGRISVDGATVDPSAVSAFRSGDPTPIRATDVSPRAPVAFRRGDVVTFHVAGRTLLPGEHAFEVEVFEVNLGRLTLALSDTVGGSRASQVPDGAPDSDDRGRAASDPRQRGTP